MKQPVCDAITSFLVMEVLEKAQALEGAGKSIIHMEIGQPDFTTQECIFDAAAKAMRDGHTGYTHSCGILPLREEMAAYYKREYGVTVFPDRIIVTNGTSAAILLLFGALFDRGGTAGDAGPGIRLLRQFRAVRGRLGYPTCPPQESEGFQLNVNDVKGKIGADTKAILVNSSSNPSGTIIAPDEFKALCSMGPRVVSDEIYYGLVYEGRAASVLEFSDDACALDGFSKRYAMTGWRLGWRLFPKRLSRSFRICSRTFSSAPTSWPNGPGLPRLNTPRSMLSRCALNTTAAARCCSLGCVRSGSPSIPTPWARFTCSPTRNFFLTIVWNSLSTSSKKRVWALRPASTSAPERKDICVSRTPTRWKTLRKPFSA
jgi:hypothetical protein